jgi:carbon storage regulator
VLYLERKVGERIVIGDGITVQVQKVRGAVAFIAIDAPKHVRIDRTEVRQAKERVKAKP